MTNVQADPSSTRPTPDPTAVFEALTRYQHSMALKAAIELEIFTHIRAGAKTAAAIAERCGASERGVRILCDFITILGFLNKTNGTYTLTPDSAAFLDKGSPAYLGTIADFLTNPTLQANYSDLAAVVRKGGTLQGAGTMEPEHDIWVHFARAMKPISAVLAQAVAPLVSQPGRKLKVLDIAAGHGMFGISVAQNNPEAEIVALDWQKVLQVALENATAAGVGDRYKTLPGSVFDVALGSDYDLVLLPNFLHHFSPEANVKLLKKIRMAMKPGSRVATVEFVPNEDRVTPPMAASFSLVMLASTEHGDAYTFGELEQMFQQAGFGKSELHDLGPTPQRLLLTER